MVFYDKTADKALNKELFKNPTAEYRGAPFWSWNCTLNREETVGQVSVLEEMGFGGGHAHVRSGLNTPYLGEEFNANIRAAAEEARKKNMRLYLYDEDRWPSGAAGGMVTKNPRFSARYLLFTVIKSGKPPVLDTDGKLLKGQKLLARYSVHTLGNKLISYKRLSDNENPLGVIWYAYLKTERPRSFLNNAPYVDVLSKEAIDCFADITYGAYQKTVGDFFGKEIKTMFTDEPQYYRFRHSPVPVPFETQKRAFTDDFDVTFAEQYGYSLLDRLPELFWDTKFKFSEARYHYFVHLSERFASAFSDNLGRRCEEMGLAYTGHLMEEPSLTSQTQATGDTMRQYKGFHIPGIDILCGRYEFTTAKQAQSAARQYGREGILSELYGVSRWDAELREYKRGGDWQAALGITLRVPHLSLMSMKGFAKRDYPASIFYQSPWFKKFKYLEDHFARVNTALTRGAPLTEIAVIHPVESFWMLYGNSFSALRCAAYDKKFAFLTDTLIRAGLDFDFISEATFPELTKEGGYPLEVGKMRYKTVIVPNCITLRSTTIERLNAFVKAGGKVIFAGLVPKYENGKPSGKPRELASLSRRIPFDKKAIIAELEENRLYGTFEGEKHTDNIVCQLREDNGGLWLFAARADISKSFITDKRHITVKVKGEAKVSLWDTLTGEITALQSSVKGGNTFVNADMYNNDSLLLRFDNEAAPLSEPNQKFSSCLSLDNSVPYALSEPNVLLLDTAYYALDGGKYSGVKYELLRLDNICRKKCGLPKRSPDACQPWAQEKKEAEHTIKLKFVIRSKIDISSPYIALEDAETAIIALNGVTVESKTCGWYTDKAIHKVALPPIKKGKNILEISMPFGLNTNVEWCYLLGDFGVHVRGAKATLTAPPKTLTFADITKQGLPFYGGEITYIASFEGNGKPVRVTVPEFRSAVLEAKTAESKNIAFAPYSAVLPSSQGKTELRITAYISRHNAFGPVHLRSARTTLTSPSKYYAPRIRTTKRYVLSPAGIMSSPQIELQ